MKYYLYLDDSGVLSKNDKFFVYGGFVVSDENKAKLNVNYKRRVKKLKRKIGLNDQSEIKGFGITSVDRSSLLRNLQSNCTQIFIVVEIINLPDHVFYSSKNTTRHKNYLVFRIVEKLLLSGKLDKCDSLTIWLDNQNVAVSAKDSLESYLHNSFNENKYYSQKKFCELNHEYIEFSVDYKDSKHSYLIQGADLLANTMYRKHCKGLDDGYDEIQSDHICIFHP